MAYRKLKVFTSLAIESAPKGSTLTEEGTRGLRMRVGFGGTRSWIYRFSGAEDRLKQVTIGSWPTLGIAEARRKWDELRSRRKSGEDPAAVTRAEKIGVARSRPTVRDVLEKYFNEHIAKERKPKGVAECRKLLERWAYPALGNLEAESLSVPAAVKFLIETKAKSLSAARVLRGELRAAWRHGLEAGLISGSNPFADILRGKLPQKRRGRYLDDAELALWLAWLPDSGITQDVRDALELTLRTACRSGEIVALAWRDVDVKGSSWTVRDPKNRHPRTVPLPREALAIMRRRRKELRASERWLFPSPVEGRHIRQHALVWSVVNARKRLDIPAWSSHDLRRTARTGMARLHVPHEVAEAALGHARGGIAGVYDLHKYEREVGTALRQWNDHLAKLQARSKKKTKELHRS